MAVALSGERRGTIGGGVMEVKSVDDAIQSLREGTVLSRIRKVFHSRESLFEQSGLICSGTQTLLAMSLDQSFRTAIDEIVQTFDRKIFGRLVIGPDTFLFESNQRLAADYSFTYSQPNEWVYKENVGVLDTVYIVGSGHVGFALSRIMATLDFHVVVIDERPSVETFLLNSYAHTKITLRYEDIGSVISVAGRSYVAVVTTAYESDERALKAVIGKNLHYIGLMGSPSKTRTIVRDLRSQDVTEEQLQQIHNPIGLPIASNTPEEIAISIAAEIIKAKNTAKA